MRNTMIVLICLPIHTCFAQNYDSERDSASKHYRQFLDSIYAFTDQYRDAESVTEGLLAIDSTWSLVTGCPPYRKTTKCIIDGRIDSLYNLRLISIGGGILRFNSNLCCHPNLKMVGLDGFLDNRSFTITPNCACNLVAFSSIAIMLTRTIPKYIYQMKELKFLILSLKGMKPTQKLKRAIIKLIELPNLEYLELLDSPFPVHAKQEFEQIFKLHGVAIYLWE